MRSGPAALYTAEVMAGFGESCPVIGKGTIGPRKLEEFEYNCKRYFSHKRIVEDKQVESIMYNVDSSAVHTG